MGTLFGKITRRAGAAMLVVLGCHVALAQPQPEAPSGWTDKQAVFAPHEMVAAANPLAAQAGLEILRAGGSAIDATVAVQMLLGLVEPQSAGLGGGADPVTEVGEGATIGPNLSDEWARGRTDDWLIGHFRNPRAYTPGTRMPSFSHLGDRQLRALVLFLQEPK